MNLSEPPKLALVIPAYNEAAIIAKTAMILTSLFEDLVGRSVISPQSFMLFVDDGSTDCTTDIIRSLRSSYIKAVRLSANVGHQSALLAGLHYVTNKVDCCISIDADLQDDIAVIEKMVVEYNAGCHIVYGVRKKRTTDTPFKRNTALLFYHLMKSAGIRIIHNHADFRLLSNKALLSLQQYKETNLFLRGIFPLMGYKTASVYYDRLERKGSTSKYSLNKMLQLALNGVTSFSNMPLKVIALMGLAIFFVSIVCSFWVVFELIFGRTVPGWASITLPLYFLGGIQLLAIGILGEYIAKIYWETKARPRYHIEEEVDNQNHDKPRKTHTYDLNLEKLQASENI